MSTLVLSYNIKMYEMVDHRKSRLRPKLPALPGVSVTNGYAATIEASISIVDVQCRVENRSRLPVSPVCILTDTLTDGQNQLINPVCAHAVRGNDGHT